MLGLFSSSSSEIKFNLHCFKFSAYISGRRPSDHRLIIMIMYDYNKIFVSYWRSGELRFLHEGKSPVYVAGQGWLACSFQEMIWFPIYMILARQVTLAKLMGSFFHARPSSLEKITYTYQLWGQKEIFVMKNCLKLVSNVDPISPLCIIVFFDFHWWALFENVHCLYSFNLIDFNFEFIIV